MSGQIPGELLEGVCGCTPPTRLSGKLPLSGRFSAAKQPILATPGQGLPRDYLCLPLHPAGHSVAPPHQLQLLVFEQGGCSFSGSSPQPPAVFDQGLAFSARHTDCIGYERR